MEENNKNNDQVQNGMDAGSGNPSNWNFDPVTGQPLNRQNPYQNQCNAPMPEHVYNEMIKQQKKIQDNNSSECRYLCIASLACWLFSNFLFYFENMLHDLLGVVYDKILQPSTGLFLIAGYVFVVIALVKYPKNTFAKVLLVIYVIEIVFMVIVAVIAIIACATILSSCFGGYKGCFNIG